ncbi:hypothetical protein T283_14405 [Listeria monocytogenes N53-1]|nr:hypothetical protein T283_14405 [Listeria monocytogenes N53-1]
MSRLLEDIKTVLEIVTLAIALVKLSENNNDNKNG